jgi:hypothetical protein
VLSAAVQTAARLGAMAEKVAIMIVRRRLLNVVIVFMVLSLAFQ